MHNDNGPTLSYIKSVPFYPHQNRDDRKRCVMHNDDVSADPEFICPALGLPLSYIKNGELHELVERYKADVGFGKFLSVSICSCGWTVYKDISVVDGVTIDTVGQGTIDGPRV